MLRGKRIACLLSTSLLFTYPNVQTPFHNLAEQSIEGKIDLNGMVQKDRFGLLINPAQEQFEKDRDEFEKKKAEELKLQKEKEDQTDNQPQWQEFTVSFYTGLEEENSIHGNVDCQNRPLERGVIANNVLSLGTKVFLDKDYGVRTVLDTGGRNFNSSNKIDLYVARLDGETREQWRHRANSYGVKHIKGYIVK